MAAIARPTGRPLQQQQQWLPDVEAGRLLGQTPQSLYFEDNRERVRYDILYSRDENLRRRLENVEDEYEEIAVEEEIFDTSNDILSQEYALLSDQQREIYEDRATATKHNQWRRMRKVGRLIENAESLAQKADDEKNGIPSTDESVVPETKTAGAPGEANTKNAFQELTPPFDRNTLKTKTGRIDKEEYF